MKRIRKYRLRWIAILLCGVGSVVALTLYGLQSYVDLYYSPSQIVQGDVPVNTRIRAGGLVVVGSVVRDQQNPLRVHFAITDCQHRINVFYQGILPDLFKEGSGIVATGQLQVGQLVAQTILAKHDENYMPPEVKKSLQTTTTQDRCPLQYAAS